MLPRAAWCRHERGTGCRRLRPRALASASCGMSATGSRRSSLAESAPDSAPERRDDVFGVPLGREVDRRRGDPAVAPQEVRLAERHDVVVLIDRRSGSNRQMVPPSIGWQPNPASRSASSSAAACAASTIDTFVARPDLARRAPRAADGRDAGGEELERLDVLRGVHRDAGVVQRAPAPAARRASPASTAARRRSGSAMSVAGRRGLGRRRRRGGRRCRRGR